MNKSDEDQFKAIMNTACAALGKPLFDGEALSLYFAILDSYSFADVQQALFKSLSSQDSKFGITPALIIRFLGVKEVRELSWQDVIEMARKPKTPMAVLARMHIKSHYLNNYEPMQIKHRADTFLDGLEEMKARAMCGDYSQHEIVCMIDHGVKVASPFTEGMQGIGDNIALRERYNLAIQSPAHTENVARIESRKRNDLPMDADGKRKAMNSINALLSIDKKPALSDNTEELKANFNEMVKGCE